MGRKLRNFLKLGKKHSSLHCNATLLHLRATVPLQDDVHIAI
jgi:hypothetical protein